MTFSSALARRSAAVRSFYMFLPLLIIAACAPGELKEGLGPNETDVAVVSVAPAKSTISVAEVVLVLATAKTATGQSAPAEVDWTSDGGTLVAVTDSSALFSATTSGSYTVKGRGRKNPKAQDSTVIVVSQPVSPIVSVSISPSATTLHTGGSQTFLATATRQDGSTLTPSVTWTATGGTISSTGLFTAGNSAGNFRVIATEPGSALSDTSAVALSTTAPTLQAVVLSPASASAVTGGTQQFGVTGQWSDGSTTAPAVTYSATGGTITAGGLYTAGSTAGSFRVIATQQGGTLADTATVTITAPVLQAVILTPASASLATAATQQFSVSGQWSNGATTAPSVTYSATGGTITAGGLYTAGSTAGSFRVIATQQGGTLADTASVTLTLPLGGTGYPNEPAGLSTPYTITAPQPNPFNVRPREKGAADGLGAYDLDSYGWLLQEGNLALATIANDPERGNVLQIKLPAGMPGGSPPLSALAGGGSSHGLSGGPGAPFEARKLFLGMYVKLSSNWEDRNILTKLLYMWSTNPAGGNNYLSFTDRANPYLKAGINLQTSEGSPMYLSSYSHSRGQWHKVEWYLELNTPGVSNGIGKAWVDGVQVLNLSTLRWIPAGQPANFDWLKLELIYGGGSNPVPADMYAWFDDWYLKVAP